jgi:hypothetical protein
MTLSRLALATLALSLPVFVAACSCAGPTAPSGRCTTSADCSATQMCVDSRCVARTDAGTVPDMGGLMDAGELPDAWGTCFTNSQCGTGYECTSGTCCASANVCGSQCCGASQTCFAGACVTPGAMCRTSADCMTGEYCEPSLGMGGDAGVPDGGVVDGGAADAGVRDAGAIDTGVMGDAGPVCTGAAPTVGRCLAIPPRCPSGVDGGGVDGGSPDGGTCTTVCEYHPPVGNLQAVTAWSWGQPTPPADFPNHIDVWSTPAVGRLYDANCDGHVDDLDPPAVIFVSGHAVDSTTGRGTCCQCSNTTPTECHRGVLRAVDGRTGQTLWSLRRASASSSGFSATSVAIGDVDRDGRMDVVAATGEGYVVLVDGNGNVVRTSDQPIPGSGNDSFGWGGGFAIADMDGDGFPEIAWGATVFHTTGGTITRAWTGSAGSGGGVSSNLSTFADVDEAPDGHLELVAGTTAYRADGTILWNRTDLTDGFPGVADMNGDGHPDVVLVASGHVTILHGRDGTTLAPNFALTGTGSGGPPTIADFDGDHHPEIGVAQQNYYSMLELNAAGTALTQVWRTANHDLSSSVTGSTVFDFEGDGIAEVIYADECFLWVYDGPTGHVRYAGLTTSFTGTEASIVADVDGDGHAEIVLVSNGADPSSSGWHCNEAPWTMPVTGDYARPAWTPPAGAPAYRGLRVLRDAARSWVGTRPIWNQHTYHVTNICVPGDGACTMGEGYGAIPTHEQSNWTLGWLDNFRQNVQQSGVFDAADATLVLDVHCTDPVVLVANLRNLGAAILPPGVQVDFFSVNAMGMETPVGSATSTGSVFPGAVEQLRLTLPAGADPMGTYRARIHNPASMPTFRECRDDNDEATTTGHCFG